MASQPLNYVAIWESEDATFASTVFYNTVAPLPHWREIAPENGNNLDRDL